MRTKKSEFQLEPLEPRLLLSGEALFGALAAPALASLDLVPQTEQLPTTDQTAVTSAQTALVDLFDTGTAASQTAVAPVAASAAPAPTATSNAPAAQTLAAQTPVATETAQVSSQEIPSPLVGEGQGEGGLANAGSPTPTQSQSVAEQLVDTLHAANGPPATGDTTTSSESSTTSNNSAGESAVLSTDAAPSASDSSSAAENISPIDPSLLEYFAPEGNSDDLLCVNPSDHSILELIDEISGQVLVSRPVAGVVKVSIHGTDAGDDTLTIDFSIAFQPAGGISFDGGEGGNDTLVLVNGNFQQLDCPSLTLGSATVRLDSLAIGCSGLESVENGLTADLVAPQLDDLTLNGGDLKPLEGQVFYLDLDGADNLQYAGPVTLGPLSVPAFDIPASAGVDQASLIGQVLSQLNSSFAGIGASFVTVRPSAGPYSTIYVGGDDSAFSDYGLLYGVSEKTDVGNNDSSDIAFVFSDQLTQMDMPADELTLALGAVIAHEAGRLLG